MFLKRLFNFIPKSEFARALALYNSGHHHKALKKFEELQRVSELNGDVDRATLDLYTCEAHVAISLEAAQAGDLATAISEMEAAVVIKPTFADLHYRLGDFHTRVGDLVAAEKSFRASLAINNKFFRAGVHLSQARRAQGDVEGAATELVAMRLSCPNFYREALDALISTLRADVDGVAVEKLYRELLEERPSSAQLSKELAIEAIQNGECDEAIRELKKAIAVKPDYPDLHNYLGIAYGNSGMLDDAAAEFEIALKINPYYLKARLNLALLYYENGRYEEAHGQLGEVLAVQPDNQLAHNIMAELRELTGGRVS